jgi:hypothetical protein
MKMVNRFSFIGIVIIFFLCTSKKQSIVSKPSNNEDTFNVSMYTFNEFVDTPKIKIFDNGNTVELIGKEVIHFINEQSNDSILFEVYPYYETLLLNLRRGIKYCQIEKVNMATVGVLLKYLDSKEQDWVAHLILIKVSPTAIIYGESHVFRYEPENNYQGWRRDEKESHKKMWKEKDWNNAPLVSEW